MTPPQLIVIVLSLVVLAGCGSATNLPPAYDGQPNILLIVADDLGYGDLGSYGQQEIQTPHLDQLASEGIRFTDFYAGNTVCAPSRSALMTGLHTGHTPIRGNRRLEEFGDTPLPDASVTIAEVLRDAGYRTGLIGKWGLGGVGSEGEPSRQGFDHYFGYLGQHHPHNYYPEILFRNGERVPLDNKLPEGEIGSAAGYSVVRNEYSHDLIADEALEFIAQSADTPFFLALTLTIPHANNEGRELGMEVPDLGIYADKPWPEPVKGHAAMISRMDADIGRIMTELEQLGIAERTMVLFTSDNGPHAEGGYDPEVNDSNGPLRGIKRDLYEGGIRVPLIVHWPGHAPTGTVTDQVGAFWDFLPTFAEAAGAETPDGLDGQSLLAAFKGGSTGADDRPLYWEFHEGANSQQAARIGRWKAIRKMPEGPLEIYDLAEDLGEEQNVADTHPEIVEQMEGYFATARTENPIWKIRYPGDPRPEQYRPPTK